MSNTVCEKYEMIAPANGLRGPDPERRIGIGWIGLIGGMLALTLAAIGLGTGSAVYSASNAEWLRSAVFGAFTLVNALRILAYVPQMLAAARDTNGAAGVSCATWSLFLVSHLTTIAYAMVYLRDGAMALIFCGNALACLAVIAITSIKRKRHAARLLQRL